MMKTKVFTALTIILITNNAMAQELKPANSEMTNSAVVPTPKENTITVQEDPSNKLGLLHARTNLEKATKHLEAGEVEKAEKILLTVSEDLTKRTENHFDLYQIYSKNIKTIDRGRIEKAYAKDFGTLRDHSFFLLAQVHIVKNKLPEASELLVEIIKSQSTSELGENAYKKLQEIRFSD